MNMQFDQRPFNVLLGYFVRGLLLVVPLALTVYIISIALNFIDRLIGTRLPGLGLAILLASIAFLGYLGSTLLVRSIFDFTESLIVRVPLINTIYAALKEFTVALVGSKKKFDRPVLIVINKDTQLRRLGFVTHQDLESMKLPGYVAVYIPQSYSFSGDLFILPKEVVIPLDILSADAIKFIVSGGVTDL